MAMVNNLSTGEVYDDSLHLQMNLTFVIKVLRRRYEFVHYVQKYVGCDFGTIYDMCTKQHPKELREMLKGYVKEPYEKLEAEITLDETQYEELFPENAQNRIFYVIIRFEDRATINKMKLKYPELMTQIGVK